MTATSSAGQPTACKAVLQRWRKVCVLIEMANSYKLLITPPRVSDPVGGLEAQLFRRTDQFNAAGTLAILVAVTGISTAAAAPPNEAPAEPSPDILVPIIVSSEKPRKPRRSGQMRH